MFLFLMISGKKISVAEPQNIVDAIKEALKGKKRIDSTSQEPQEEIVQESKRSKG